MRSSTSGARVRGRDDALVRPGAHPQAARAREGVQRPGEEQHPAVPRAAADPADPDRPHHLLLHAEPRVLMSDPRLSRHRFLSVAAVSVLTPWPPLPSGEGERESPVVPPRRMAERGSGGEDSAGGEGAVRLGVASYSLRNFPLATALDMVQALGTRYVNLKSVHLPYELSPGELRAARQKIEAAGLQIVGGGVITFERDTDADVERYFAYAKAAGMPLITATADPAILPRLERFAKQYEIMVAIHNHGPEDKRFPSPYDALKHVRNMDSRMGLCIDVGHTVRTGADVVKAVADAGPRLLDMHAKDLRDLTAKGSQCIVGEGAIPIAAIFQQLQAMRYGGFVNLEYEIDADDPLPGMKQSFAYMRGVLAGLASARRSADRLPSFHREGAMSKQQRPRKPEIPRREFLKTAAGGVAGMALSGLPAASYARILGANDRVRVGVVGFSDRFRQALLPAFGKVGKELGFEIVAVSDIWSRRRDEGVAEIEKVTGARPRPFRNNEEMYEARATDAVMISTPDFLHAYHGVEAMRAGQDAYIEKPLAHTMADAIAIRDAVKQSDRIVQIGTQRRSAANYRMANEYLRSGSRTPTGSGFSHTCPTSHGIPASTSSIASSGRTRRASRTSGWSTRSIRCTGSRACRARAASSPTAASTCGRMAARAGTPSRSCSTTGRSTTPPRASRSCTRPA